MSVAAIFDAQSWSPRDVFVVLDLFLDQTKLPVSGNALDQPWKPAAGLGAARELATPAR